jgi:hypothetical protein
MKLVLRDAHIFIGSPNEADQMTELAYTKKMFRKYKSWQQVQSHFSTGMPIYPLSSFLMVSWGR